MKKILATIIGVAVTTATLTACTADGGDSGGTEASESILNTVLEDKVLRVGMLADVPPFASTDSSNEMVGIDPDFAALMAKDLGVKLEITVLPDSAARVTALQSRSLDIVFGNFTVTPERAETIAFSDPYGVEALVFEGNAGSPEIESFDDLKGKKVAIVTGSFQENLVTLVPDGEFVTFADFAAPLLALKSGQVDYILNDRSVCNQDVEKDPSLACLGPAYQNFLALGVPQGDQVWLNWVNTFVNYHGGDGSLGAIYKKWAGEDMPKVLPDF